MPNMLQTKKSLLWIAVSLIIIIVDQISKWLAVNMLSFHAPVIINRFFNLTLDYNKGAAFSFLNDAEGWQRWFFSGIALAVSIIIVIYLIKSTQESKINIASLGLILGGAIGNLIDRVLHGYVIDFISWHVGDYYWPTFNIADSAVCVGAVLLILGLGNDKK